MLDNLLRQYVRRWQTVQVIKAVVLEPEDIETRLVAGDEILVFEVAEALRLLTFVTIGRVVGFDELLQVFAT